MSRPSTPPPARLEDSRRDPITPEVKRRIETNRLKAKAIREALQKAESSPRTISTRATTTQKRSYSEISSVRESTNNPTTNDVPKPGLGTIHPARNFQRKDFIEFDFSKIKDTKGGFLSTEDDPHSMLAAQNLQDKPPGMSLEEWARHQLRLKLQKEKTGVYEPGISALTADGQEQKKCYDCDSPEIDWKWLEVFHCRVCNKCKEANQEKYSLLTKTEAREDYLLTDPELRDAELLPHLERPNPHKSTWNNMMLYLRYQVEAHAVKKWGGLEALDKEFEKRTAEKKRRKDVKFRSKLRELKRKTRVDSWKKNTGSGGRHEHVWGTAVTREEGGMTRTCEECGLEVEEMVF